MYVHVFVVFLQRKACGSISGARTVLKADVNRAADAGAVMVNVNSDDCEQPRVDNCCDTSVYSDHLYCKTEAADEQAAVSGQPVELGLKDDSIDTESTQHLLLQSPACYVGTQSEQSYTLSQSYASSHKLGSVCSSSGDTCNPDSDTPGCPSVMTTQSSDAVPSTPPTQSSDAVPSTLGVTSNSLLELDVDVSRCPSVMTTQSSDAVPLTLGVTSNSLLELDVAHTEDVSLDSSSTSGISDDNIETASLEMTSSTIDQQLADTVIDATDNSEVVDVTDGRSVELECQCGAQYSDPSDKLHVVECQRCHSHQHAACVNYDLTDSLRGNYLCPHCHVIEVCAMSVCSPHA